jgi:phosphoribosylpyrophosphate synthetase
MSNDATMSQFSVLIVLLQSFIKSMTIVIPFFPVGTMDRVDVEGKIATANTHALIFSSLPSCGKPSRIMIYDIHALQERFFFHSACTPSLHSAIPLLLSVLENYPIQAVCFPDDGAAKRFQRSFLFAGYEVIVCGKVRDGNRRLVRIQDGDPRGKNVILVDDLAQTGGTLHEAGVALKANGALNVYAFVSHAVFPNNSFQKFLWDESGSGIFTKFWVTNSVPLTIEKLPTDNVFEVIDLLPQIVADLDFDG